MNIRPHHRARNLEVVQIATGFELKVVKRTFQQAEARIAGSAHVRAMDLSRILFPQDLLLTSEQLDYLAESVEGVIPEDKHAREHEAATHIASAIRMYREPTEA